MFKRDSVHENRPVGSPSSMHKVPSDIDEDSSEYSYIKMAHHQNVPAWAYLYQVFSKKEKWKFSKQSKKWAKAKFLKHIYDQEIKESILQNNPVPINFLSWQKLDDYLLEILSETGKKDEIFSDRPLWRHKKIWQT